MENSVLRAVEVLQKFNAGSDLSLMRRGIEKESLRVNQDGTIAQTRHPLALGSALTHPYITTDYSEALVELVTPPCSSVRDTLNFLDSLHHFVVRNIESETLWATSMPCIIKGERSIPIAEYGISNIGKMKHVYRVGLSHRYGRLMQSISGIHFNFSLGDDFWLQWRTIKKSADELVDFKSKCYFALIRNFYRNLWVVLYLYRASPAVCNAFLYGRDHDLEDFGHGTFYLPNSTSLRMGNLGYQSDVQTSIEVDFENIDLYCQSLVNATKTVYPKYEAIGVRDGKDYQQLNTNILQIENEYYAPIRPKRVARSGERPTTALLKRGVEYVEIRCIDIDPFLPSGIDEHGIKFIELLLIGCLFKDSPSLTKSEMMQLRTFQNKVVSDGRTASTTLPPNFETNLQDSGTALVTELRPIASLLDSSGETGYETALDKQLKKFENPELTPSAKILANMMDRNISFFEFAMTKSTEHKHYFDALQLSQNEKDFLSHEARNSIHCQTVLEAADSQSFEEFLNLYYS